MIYNDTSITLTLICLSMATFFGEILPVRSRAVDDDEDEEENVVPEW